MALGSAGTWKHKALLSSLLADGFSELCVPKLVLLHAHGCRLRMSLFLPFVKGEKIYCTSLLLLGLPCAFFRSPPIKMLGRQFFILLLCIDLSHETGREHFGKCQGYLYAMGSEVYSGTEQRPSILGGGGASLLHWMKPVWPCHEVQCINANNWKYFRDSSACQQYLQEIPAKLAVRGKAYSCSIATQCSVIGMSRDDFFGD